MLHSSLGFHTMTLSLTLEAGKIQPLIRHFRKYSRDTGLIQIYRIGERKKLFEYNPTPKFEYVLPTHIKVKYHGEDRGIAWSICSNNRNMDFQAYMVEVTINPKILAGIHDYITAATYEDMDAAITNFNLEARKISPILETFDCYSLKRVDYCINFCLDELIDGISPEQIMNLIRRSTIPPHFKEWTTYDPVSHRKKSRPGSFYLINSSVNINCYSKYMQLMERSQENIEKGYPPIPQKTLDASKNIIRFEVQCKYHKMYKLSKKAEESGNHDKNKYKRLLSHETCNEVINCYYKKTIGRSDWYTLADAVRMVKFCNYNSQKEKRLIDALNIVNQLRSVARAKECYHGQDLDTFKRTLNDLSSMNINPVTIPKEWGYRHIPNLLYIYYDKKQKEEMQKQWMEEFLNRGYGSCIKEFECLSV